VLLVLKAHKYHCLYSPAKIKIGKASDGAIFHTNYLKSLYDILYLIICYNEI